MFPPPLREVAFLNTRRSPLSSTWRSGFGLLEVVLVFAIVLAASAVTFTVFDSAQRRSKVSEEMNLLAVEGRALTEAFGNGHDYSGLTTALAIASKVVIPPPYVVSSTKAVNAYGAKLQIASFGGASAAFKPCRSSPTACYAITTSVPAGDCFDLVTALEGPFHMISVNSLGVTAPGNVFDNEMILAACQSADPALVKVYGR